MAIDENDATAIEVEEKTLGGDTYYVRHPKWDNEERVICFRKVKAIPKYGRAGLRCEREAGYKTDHVGTGACLTHGGMRGRKNLKHGGRSTAVKLSLRNRVDAYIEKDQQDLLDLTFELATVRTLFQDLVDLFPDVEHKDYPLYMNRANKMVSTISSMVDKMSKIETRNTLTANHVLYLKATVADLFMKYIPDIEARERAAKELMERLPGGDVVTEKLSAEIIEVQNEHQQQ